MNELERLKLMLTDAGIVWHEMGEGQIEVRNMRSGVVVSAICTEYSIGGSEGLIEIDSLLRESERRKDTIVGNLTAREVYRRIDMKLRKLKRDRDGSFRRKHNCAGSWLTTKTRCRICKNAPRMFGGSMCKECFAKFEDGRV